MIAVQNLLRAAAHNQPLTLTNEEVREIALTVMGMDNMIAAYVEEFGQALADALTGADEVEVEGEIVNDEEETTLGLPGEDDGLDSSEEE